jgi:hypothetical protein
MPAAEQVLKCKECGTEFVYVPRKVTVFRAGVQQEAAPAAGRVIRVYLECPKKHTYEYAVQA